MSDFQPLVSVIVPTTHDREEYNQRILSIFNRQDYRARQIIFDYDEGVIGHKRNRLCSVALGNVILSMDSDDLYASNWITKSVEALIKSEADIVGLAEFLFYDTRNGAWYVYTYPPTMKDWVAGATMCFWKKYWQENQFAFVNIGEDNKFLKGVKKSPKLFAHEYGDGFVATVHDGNTSKKILANPRYRRCTEEEEIVLFDRWKDFVTSPKP